MLEMLSILYCVILVAVSLWAVLKLLRGTSEDPHPGPKEKKRPGLGKVSVFDQRNHAPTGLPLVFFLAAVDALKQGVDPNCNW